MSRHRLRPRYRAMNRAYLDYCRKHGELIQQEHREARLRHLMTPALTQMELLRVYETARVLNTDILRRTAAELFPDRFGDEPPEIYIFRGGNRAFLHPKRGILPDFTIGTPPLTQIGIMWDGTAYPY